jgi:hypothetical protein
MKFAKYWEKINLAVDKKHFDSESISIWGASNTSSQDALDNAHKRAQEFKAFCSDSFNDSQLYQYSNGYIKEEVLDEFSSNGEVIGIISRNYYGAKILNSNAVFFGDIDIKPKSSFFSKLLNFFGKKENTKNTVINAIKHVQEQNNQYSFKVYETFAGLRVVITNKIFSANSKEVDNLFKLLNVDPLYAKLCKNQACFRARLTPKPWRIGVSYPTPETRYPRKNQNFEKTYLNWLNKYEQISQKYCVVKEVASFGSHPEHPQVTKILAIHNKFASNKNSDLA